MSDDPSCPSFEGLIPRVTRITQMNSIHTGSIIGGTLGLGLSALLFMNVQWYHDLVVWSWTSPWMWAIAVPVGIAAAVISDD